MLEMIEAIVYFQEHGLTCSWPESSGRKMTMRISFDLDDTLILKTVEGCTDPTLPPLKRNSTDERLREGTKELLCALAGRGCEIWIYSNSFRGKTELLNWFSQCGLPVRNVVNQQMHDVKRAELGLLTLR